MPAMQNPAMSPQLIAAMQARQQGGQPTPALSQMSPGTPQGAQMAPPPPSVPQSVSSATSAMPQGMNQSGGKGQPPSSEVEMLIKALSQADRLPMKAMSDRLKFLSSPPSLPTTPANDTAGPSPVAGDRTAFQIRNDMPGGMAQSAPPAPTQMPPMPQMPQGGGDPYMGGWAGQPVAAGGGAPTTSQPISASLSSNNPYAGLKNLYDSFMTTNPSQPTPGAAAGGIQ